MLIEELTPSTNHEYISSKYNNENKEECEQKLDTPIQRSLDTPSPSKIGHPLKKELDTPTPVQASSYIGLEEQEGIQAKLDTPPQPALDTNILRVNNINNNTHARGFNDKTYTIDFADKNNNIDQSVHTNSAEIKTLNTEEKKSSYADLAFGFLTEPTQSACLKFS
ncbi:hypothetical protein MPCS_01764 (plasmid) [Candidatus Megaera polyxenophila]|nr:hypothetical protein MPCS_01764 [Candidatus Megaera polyxenophila]